MLIAIAVLTSLPIFGARFRSVNPTPFPFTAVTQTPEVDREARKKQRIAARTRAAKIELAAYDRESFTQDIRAFDLVTSSKSLIALAKRLGTALASDEKPEEVGKPYDAAVKRLDEALTQYLASTKVIDATAPQDMSETDAIQKAQNRVRLAKRNEFLYAVKQANLDWYKSSWDIALTQKQKSKMAALAPVFEQTVSTAKETYDSEKEELDKEKTANETELAASIKDLSDAEGEADKSPVPPPVQSAAAAQETEAPISGTYRGPYQYQVRYLLAVSPSRFRLPNGADDNDVQPPKANELLLVPDSTLEPYLAGAVVAAFGIEAAARRGKPDEVAKYEKVMIDCLNSAKDLIAPANSPRFAFEGMEESVPNPSSLVARVPASWIIANTPK